MSDDDPSMLRQTGQGRPIGVVYTPLEREPSDRSIHGSGIYGEIS